MSLRLIVAIALVATALSAPTWTKQLTILSSSADTVVTDNCACTGCEGAYKFTQGENWDTCKTACEADCKCVFAMFDGARANPQIKPFIWNNSSDYQLTHTACWHYDIQSVDPRHPRQARPEAHAGGNANFKCATMPSAGTAQGHPCGGATCGACPTDSPTPTPSYAPSWHTERPTPAPSAQYQYSDLGSNSCPSGCSAINDLQTCKNTLSDAQSMNPAASQLGGNTAGTGSGGNYGSGRPGGCFLHNPNKHIHFNTDSTGGNSHGDDYKICKCPPSPSATTTRRRRSWASTSW